MFQIATIIGMLVVLMLIRHFISSLFRVDYKFIVLAIIVFALVSLNFNILKSANKIEYDKIALLQQNYDVIEVEDETDEDELNYATIKDVEVVRGGSENKIIVVTLLDGNRRDLIVSNVSSCHLNGNKAYCFGTETIDEVIMLGYYHYVIVINGTRLNENPYFYFNWYFYFGVTLT